MIKLIHGDCLNEMDKLIKQGIKFDCILTDPPYGTTACKWDFVIPFDEMWKRLRALRNDTTPIILFGSEPFSSALRMSNIKEFKYDWIWNKSKAGNFANVKTQPLKIFEIISIFSKHNYYPQMTKNKMRLKGGYPSKYEKSIISGVSQKINDLYYPKAIINFTKANNIDSRLHPTQKPVALLEYLIKTYTKEGDLVLDFTMGSGSTGVACKNLNRNFIGIEKEEKYFKIAEQRIAEAGRLF